MADAATVATQKQILANQRRILANRSEPRDGDLPSLARPRYTQGFPL